MHFRALIVEDDESDLALLRAQLSRIPDMDFALTTTPTLAGARREVLRQSHDVLLADLNLPDSCGVESVTALRAAIGDVPIVVLTGIEDDGIALACIEAGAQDFIVKVHITPITLRRVIGFAISRSRDVHVRQLQRSLREYRRLVASQPASAGIDWQRLPSQSETPSDRLYAAHPERFEPLRERYAEVLDAYLGRLAHRGDKPETAMAQLAETLGEMGAGPRDLIELHAGALEKRSEGPTTGEDRAHLVEARVLALEMMSLLVDCYRRRLFAHGRPR